MELSDIKLSHLFINASEQLFLLAWTFFLAKHEFSFTRRRKGLLSCQLCHILGTISPHCWIQIIKLIQLWICINSTIVAMYTVSLVMLAISEMDCGMEIATNFNNYISNTRWFWSTRMFTRAGASSPSIKQGKITLPRDSPRSDSSPSGQLSAICSHMDSNSSIRCLIRPLLTGHISPSRAPVLFSQGCCVYYVQKCFFFPACALNIDILSISLHELEFCDYPV